MHKNLHKKIVLNKMLQKLLNQILTFFPSLINISLNDQALKASFNYKICNLTWGFITEHKPKSVPKNGKKLVVLGGNLSEPNLKNWILKICTVKNIFSLCHNDRRISRVLNCKISEISKIATKIATKIAR